MLNNLLKIILSLLLLAFAISSIDLDVFVTKLFQLKPAYLIGAFVIQFCLSFVQALRWRIIVDCLGTRITMLGAWKNVLLGLFFNQILPTSIGGDAIRIYAAKTLGLGLAFHSIVYDRIFALVSLSGLGIFIVIWFTENNQPLPHELPMFSLQLLVILGFLFLLFIEPLSKIFHIEKIPFIKKINSFSNFLHGICLNRGRLLQILLLSLLIHLAVSASGILLFLSMEVEASLWALGAIFALINLFSVIPISIAGWGLRESLALTLYSTVLLDGEMALIVSICFGFVMMAVGGVGGFIWAVSGKSGKGLKV
ncbi:flippase-like domain-containing protein [Alphaproteobacteria bacterium]|nr:flippase-like domain-containing protein [Alphaproteobacteria bacterium]